MEPRIAPFTYQHYQYILNSAQESSYEFVSFSALKTHKWNSKRICILRHDCDNDLTAAVAIARIEKNMGIRSTYFLMLRSAMYNLLCLSHSELVREIIQLGHWIGLHFDELCYPKATASEIAGYVERERRLLSEEFGVPVEVVSFHQPSEKVLQNVVKLDCLNTYDKKDMHGVYYLSDSNTIWKEGCPSHFFHEKKYSKLQLLLHPEWWTLESKTIQQKWQQMFCHNFELVQQSLLKRERAYTRPVSLQFYDTEQ